MRRLPIYKILCLALTLSAGSYIHAQAQYIATIAGTGVAGYNGDGISGISAQLNSPRGVAVDKAGNLFVADMLNNRVRKISATGSITTIAGTGTSGNTGDGAAATSATLSAPSAVAVDTDGNVYIVSGLFIRKVNKSGVISTVAGNGSPGYNGENINALGSNMSPTGVFVDRPGNIYIAEESRHRVRKVNTSGVISTVAGNGSPGYNGDNIAANTAQLNIPKDVCVDTMGNIYIADYGNNRIRMIGSTSGNISTIAGSGTAGYSGDYGQAINADLNGPNSIATDEVSVYFIDVFNNRVRKINAGKITSVAGNGVSSYNGDGQTPLTASFSAPASLAASASGSLYIADGNNNRIRMASGNWYRDNDADGFGKPGTLRKSLAAVTGYAGNNGDCNDSSANPAKWDFFGQSSISKAAASYTDIAIDNGENPVVVYSDGAYSGKATVMSHNGGSWSAIGTVAFSADVVSHPRIAIDPRDVHYVAFVDGSASGKATVMKYDGSAWVLVGSAGFSTVVSTSGNVDLLIDGTGTPYIAYSDASTSDVIVMRYGGINWTSLGTVGTATSTAGEVTLAADIAGNVYAAFADGANGGKVSVKKYDGSSWSTVGSAGFSAGVAVYPSLTIDPNTGEPYLAYSDAGSGNKIAVKRYNGTSWVNVGAQSFSSGAVTDVRVRFDNTGMAYVAFKDAGISNKVSMLKYKSGFWVSVGTPGLTPGLALFASFAIDRTGIPYVAFRDGSSSGSNKAAVMSISSMAVVPTKPSFSGTLKVCKGTPTVLEITGGSLNDAANWQWFTGSCGGTPLSTNKSIAVTPPVTTRYYARAQGACLSNPGDCDSITVTVDPILPHSVTLSASPDTNVWANGLPVTFTANSTNSGTSPTYQWYKNGVLVTGVPGNIYNAGPVQENDLVCVSVLSDADCAQPTLVSTCVNIHLDLGVNGLNNRMGIRLFPNPNSGVFSIAGNVQAHEGVEIEVRNTLGQVVYQDSFIATSAQLNKTIAVKETIAHGVYILTVRNGADISRINFIVQ